MSTFLVVTTIRSLVHAESQQEAESMFQCVESEVCLEIIKHPRIAVESVKSFATIQG